VTSIYSLNEKKCTYQINLKDTLFFCRLRTDTENEFGDIVGKLINRKEKHEYSKEFQ
jgi:hypothetical protein